MKVKQNPHTLNADTNFKNVKPTSATKQPYTNNHVLPAAKLFEQPYIRRRYSFDNSTGTGYQGL